MIVALLPAIIAGATAVGIAIGNAWQKRKSDGRDAFWKRLQWAMEAASTPGDEYADRRIMGFTTLSALADEKLATAADQAMIAAIADQVLEQAPSPPELDFWDSVLKRVDEDE